MNKKNLLPFLLLGLAAKIYSEPLPSVIYSYIDSSLVEQKVVLNSEEIKEANVSDLPSLLVSCGIQILSYGTYGLEQKPSIRGFTDETVRVIIDGVCVNNAQYGTFDFSTLSLNDIERIEIVKGGFTEGVSDEGAVGGAVYITTKKQTLGHHFNISSSLKTFFNKARPLDTFSQSFGYSGQLTSSSFLKTNIQGTFANNNFYYYDYLNRKKTEENARVIDGSASVNYSFFFGNGNTFSINDLFYAGNKNTPGTKSQSYAGNQKDYDNNLNLQLSFPEITKGLKLESSLSWLSNTRFYTEKSKESEHYVNTVKYALTTEYSKLSFFNEKAGLTLDYVHLDSSNDGLHNQLSGALKNTSGFIFKKDNSLNSFCITLPLAIKFSNKNFAFTPKLGFAYKTHYVDFLLDGYRMVQFPNMDDLYWQGDGNTGNPDLKPEKGWGADFTINVHDCFLPFSLCAFTNYYESKIQWVMTSSGYHPENIASAFYAGLDFNIEKSFFKDRLVFSGSAEYLYTRLLDQRIKYTYGKRIMWTPDLTASASIKVNLPSSGKLKKTTFILEANYMGKRYKNNTNSAYLEPYLLINLCSQLTFTKKDWSFIPYFRIDNLLNQNYESIDNYAMPMISSSLGLKIEK